MQVQKNTLFPLWVGLGFYFSIRLTVDSITKVRFWERAISTTLIEIIGTILISYLIVYGLSFLIHRFDQMTFSSPEAKIKYELLRVWIFTMLLFNIFGNLIAATTDDGLNFHDLIVNNILGSLITIVLYLYFRARQFLNDYIKEKVKGEQLKREKIETELKYLKAQINPHFLFNSLNGIYVQIGENPKASQKTLEKFSQMLRYQLYECSNELVALEKEIAFLEDYISLEQLRKSEKLKLNSNLKGHFSNYKIAPFLLQPLVENAFKHLGGTLEIDIIASMKGQILHFQVSNTFVEAKPKLRIPTEGGIGLNNLERRLKLLYQDKHEFFTNRNGTHFIANLKVDLNEN